MFGTKIVVFDSAVPAKFECRKKNRKVPCSKVRPRVSRNINCAVLVEESVAHHKFPRESRKNTVVGGPSKEVEVS